MLKRLRVLELSNCNITELPASIGNLKHLRCINLSETSIQKLPDSLSNLHNLQVLGLGRCQSLRALPSNMSALINLRHLDASCELVSNIQGLGKLTALQEITVYGRKVSELGDMGMLKKLSLFNLEQVPSKGEAVRARLDAKEHLEVLVLRWNRHRDEQLVNQTLEEEVLEGLGPVDTIKYVCIDGYKGVKFPSWMEDDSWLSSFLERVELEYCRNWEVLPPLGRLGCLKFLTISGMVKLREIGPQFFGCCADGVRVLPAGFPSLEGLHFYNMPEWEEWRLPQQPHDRDEGGDDDEDGQGGQQRPPPPPILFLPRLRILGITDCPKLRELPPLPPTLTDVRIKNCQELTSLGGIHTPKLLPLVEAAAATSASPVSSPVLLRLKSLAIYQSSPQQMTMWLRQCSSLQRLQIANCPQLTCFDDEMGRELEAALLNLAPSLQSLQITACRSLCSLPSKLRSLSSLDNLFIDSCPEIQCLPAGGLPESLKELHISGCRPSLRERCEEEGGPDWPLISHIPLVRIL